MKEIIPDIAKRSATKKQMTCRLVRTTPSDTSNCRRFEAHDVSGGYLSSVMILLLFLLVC